jgi:hypothetical protein
MKKRRRSPSRTDGVKHGDVNMIVPICGKINSETSGFPRPGRAEAVARLPEFVRARDVDMTVAEIRRLGGVIEFGPAGDPYWVKDELLDALGQGGVS